MWLSKMPVEGDSRAATADSCGSFDVASRPDNHIPAGQPHHVCHTIGSRLTLQCLQPGHLAAFGWDLSAFSSA